MKLSDWAKQKGITYRTAWEHFRTGKIPNAYKLESGTIIVPDENIIIKPEYVVTYARVSSSENKSNLESQSNRLIAFCNAKGWQTHFNIKEIGSGLNDKRQKLEIVLLKGGLSPNPRNFISNLNTTTYIKIGLANIASISIGFCLLRNV